MPTVYFIGISRGSTRSKQSEPGAGEMMASAGSHDAPEVMFLGVQVHYHLWVVD